MHVAVGSTDHFLDLLFYHLKLRRFVVVELKAVPFDPAFVGQINLYLSAVDDQMRHPSDAPTIGLLLCRAKHHVVVEYALRGMSQPIGVAGWETRLFVTISGCVAPRTCLRLAASSAASRASASSGESSAVSLDRSSSGRSSMSLRRRSYAVIRCATRPATAATSLRTST